MYGAGRERVLYVEGSRPLEVGRCLLVAHADTVWDRVWQHTFDEYEPSARLIQTDGIISSADRNRGIGADDRAGLAILWLLKDLGHTLLITDLEEHGRLGSSHLRAHEPELLARINREHAFAVQFDRRNHREFKCYDVGTPEFRSYIQHATGYTEPDRRNATDICTLCDPLDDGPRMCGVNLSVGYYDEHTPDEHLVVAEWQHTLNLARRWLAVAVLPCFRH